MAVQVAVAGEIRQAQAAPEILLAHHLAKATTAEGQVQDLVEEEAGVLEQ
jgi:hypothetical protein